MRKLRFADARRGKGTRGGLRVICALRTNGRTLENWEQGRAAPNSQARLLIRMAAAYPDTVQRLASL